MSTFVSIISSLHKVHTPGDNGLPQARTFHSFYSDAARAFCIIDTLPQRLPAL